MATAKESLSGNIAFGMPVREFLESFLPVDVPQQAKFKKSDFQDFYTQGHEQIDCLNLKELTKYSMWIMIGNNMTWFSPVSVQTNGAGITVPSDGSTWIPDLIVRHTQDVDSKNPRTSDLSSGEFFIEVRDTDNLIDTGNPGEYSDRELNTIYSVLLHSLNHKYATHIYHVICTPCIARLLRLDRSSLVISQPIPIDKDSTLLAEFLWRYTNADSEARGYDTTVRFPSEAEIALAESHLSSFLRGCKGRHAFVIFDVPSGPPNSSDKLQASDVVSSSLSMKHFIACEPISQSPKGRATIGYAALDLLSKRVVFLKDSWRTDTDQFCKEADILRDLNAHSVKHVPTLLAGGDLPGPYQRTWTRNIVDADWRMGPKTDIVPRAHHRLVEDYLPNDLFSFKTPRSLMQFTYDTLIAHQEAYEKCGVLHRDISPNNIRIKNDEEGILADWDHAVYIHRKEAGKSESSANVFGRVGTLPYIAYGLAMKPNQPKVLMHDLESVLWLVLDMGLCFIPFATSDSLDIHFHYNRLFHPAELLSPTPKREDKNVWF